MSNETIKAHLKSGDNMWCVVSSNLRLEFSHKFKSNYGYNKPKGPKIWYVEAPNTLNNSNSINKSNYALFPCCIHATKQSGRILINTFCRHNKTIAAFDKLQSGIALDPIHATKVQKKAIIVYLQSISYQPIKKAIDHYFGLEDAQSFFTWRNNESLFNFLSSTTIEPLVLEDSTGAFSLDTALLTHVLDNLSLETLAPFIERINIANPTYERAPMLLKPSGSPLEPSTSDITYRLAFLCLKHSIALRIGLDKKDASSIIPDSLHLLFDSRQQALLPNYPQFQVENHALPL